ncbi:MAG: HAMP domain-containing protein [Deltaproteobacteria bacterium]|nr:HAMP domain-containing protein [Deltaproteobacteria bacterium]
MVESLPTGGAYVRRILVYTAAYSLLAIGVITLYLSGLLRMGPEQWRRFFEVVGCVFVVIFPAMTLSHRGIFQRIQRCLDRHAAGEATPEELQGGFAAVCDFPRYWFVWGLVWWAIGGAAVGSAMWLRYPDFGAFRASIVLLATVSGAFVTDMYYFLTIKRVLAPAREALAAEIREVQTRQKLIRPVPLRTKLLAALSIVILVTVSFAALLSEVRTQRSVESAALQRQQSVLAAIAAAEAFSFEEVQSQLAALGSMERLVLLDASAERVLAGSAEAVGEGRLRRMRQLGLEAGDSSTFEWITPFSWRRLPGEGLVLVSLTAPSELDADAGAGDVGEAIARLQSAAARVAAGDLTRGEILESEDEMGDLARSFEGMAASLRGTVARVTGAADRMQSAAGEIASASQNVARATASQVGGIAQATASMGSIDGQVREIARSAESLDADVDGASSAIFELDASGSELSSGAGVLSASVDEVASSIEQMASSISQVHEGSEALAAAADDASSSMEETASAAREVDASAAEMSLLSTRVIEFAESGHGQVRETIRGMNAIHEATDSARRVIEKLGDSTRKIDSVIGVIDGVADETNLLALNAAIIAAQAGEHGRAFAVVAGQIKELANRVLASTKEVAELVHAVQQESSDASGAIALGSKSVQHGVELAGEAGASLAAITQAARESGSRIGQIASAVQQQSQAVRHVAELMENVRSGTEEIRRVIGEQRRSTSFLNESSTSMGDVSKRVQQTTMEQAQSTTGIRQNMESIRTVVGQINGALRDQAGTCRDAVEFLENVNQSTHSNEESVQRLEDAMRSLLAKADELHGEVASFRI